jgi:hypothetical protein
MSGGYFNYIQYQIYDMIDTIGRIIRNNNNNIEINEYGDIISSRYSEDTIAIFKEAMLVLTKAYVYAHRIDWLLSGDDGEEQFHQRLNEELKGMK